MQTISRSGIGGFVARLNERIPNHEQLGIFRTLNLNSVTEWRLWAAAEKVQLLKWQRRHEVSVPDFRQSLRDGRDSLQPPQSEFLSTIDLTGLPPAAGSHRSTSD